MTVNEKIDEILSTLDKAPWIKTVPDNHKTWMYQCTTYPTIQGLWLEMGVYRGKTIQHIAKNTSNTVHGFDSFYGLHEHWDADNPQGVYSLNGQIPDGAIDLSVEHSDPGMYNSSPTRSTIPWPANVKLYAGFFEQTIPEFVKNNKESISFIHIDSDLYSSAKTIFEQLESRFIKGTVICFDDFPGYPEFKDKNHEVKAFAEFLLKTGFEYKTLAFHPSANYSQACFVLE